MRYLADQKQSVRIKIAKEITKRIKAEMAKGKKYKEVLRSKILMEVLREHGLNG